MTQALQTIERRVNELGVAEPIVARQGGDQILVQLPGVTDVQRAKDIIRSTALLELKLVEQGPFSSQQEALTPAYNNAAARPADRARRRRIRPARPARRPRMYYVVRRVSAVTGRDLRNARPTLDENNLPAVSFSLNQDGARKFGDGHASRTSAASSRIILDNRVFVGADDPEPHHGRGPHHRHRSRAGGPGSLADRCGPARCRRR